jgi:hypothetical protein
MGKVSAIDQLFNHFSLFLICNKFFLVDQRAFSGDHLKIFMKGGKIIKAAFITKLFNTEMALNKHFAGMTNPDLY